MAAAKISSFQHEMTLEEKKIFAYEQLLKLATISRLNPNTGETELYIDLCHVYEGTGYLKNPDQQLPQAPSSRTSLPDTDIIWPAADPALRYSNQKEALTTPGEKEDPPVDAPLRPTGGVLSAPEIFGLICRHPNYPYFRLDMDIISYNKDSLAKLIEGAILFEACGGGADKILHLLRVMGNKKPKYVIENDSEEINLQHLLHEIADFFGTADDVVPNAPPPPSVYGVCGDWMKAATYQGKVYQGENNKAPWPYLKRDVLKAFRDDPTRTVVFLPGATANNFYQPDFLKFLHDNFKPGTVFLVTICYTIDLKKLTRFYKDHPLVQQLALTGLTGTVWKRLEWGEERFDPRLIGIDVTPVKWGKNANVQISVFLKDRPEKRINITPIEKWRKKAHMRLMNESKLEVFQRFGPSMPTDAQTEMIAFCHQGYSAPFRKLLKPTP